MLLTQSKKTPRRSLGYGLFRIIRGTLMLQRRLLSRFTRFMIKLSNQYVRCVLSVDASARTFQESFRRLFPSLLGEMASDTAPVLHRRQSLFLHVVQRHPGEISVIEHTAEQVHALSPAHCQRSCLARAAFKHVDAAGFRQTLERPDVWLQRLATACDRSRRASRTAGADSCP